MRRVSPLFVAVVPLLVLLFAVPAGAAGFARQGALVAGGGVLFESDSVEGPSSETETLHLDLSPELTYFLVDRIGLRLAPSFFYLEETYRAKQLEVGPTLGAESPIGATVETSSATGIGLAAGPVYYLPLTGGLHLGVGVQLGYDLVVLGEESDSSGLTYGGNVGLALAIGEGGVVEAGLRYDHTDRTHRRDGYPDVESERGEVGVGFRVGVVL